MQFKLQLLFYNLSRNQKFDIFIMIFIMLNMLTMAIEFEGMTDDYQTGLEYVNIAFLTIFSLECVVKILGLRLYYFKEPWNVFDFVVVVVSLCSKSDRYVTTFSFRCSGMNRTRSCKWVRYAKTGIHSVLFWLCGHFRMW